MEVSKPEEFFTFSQEQLEKLRDLRDLETQEAQYSTMANLLGRISLFFELFRFTFSILLGWILSFGNEKSLTICKVSNRQRSLKEDPNAKFLQPEGSQRYVLLPIRFPILFKFAEGLRDLPWSPGSADVDLGSDKRDFEELTKKEPGLRELILNVLGYFAASDGLILENVQTNFAEEVAIPECRAFYAVQAQNEFIHEHMYNLLIICYGDGPAEQERLFKGIENMDAVKAKASWAQFWLNKRHSFAERLVAYTAVEGLHFACSFSIIWWLKDRFGGKMSGLTKSNEWISRDENMHVEFAIALFHHLPFPIALGRIREIYISALNAEMMFLRKIVPKEKISGLAIESLEEHVRYMANFWFTMFQDPKNAELLIRNPDDSIPQPRAEFRKISKFSKVNFFEVRNASYAQPTFGNQKISTEGKW